ncbi:type 1 glutamine amidotransferase [Paenibacillus protaetiae]|uniref:Type 1 glutamine amidotransferase n=1 Tax=Paenibacillus protaetiae TaxID=2509456 RepID=A0A4P6F6Q0_9BACL|nr:type 1 glutamine amidotransferase [Paenibacillus protaetiae]QAY66088.1 type 1 glutamine amidotransferase [Paenibacillus protaetiae]
MRIAALKHFSFDDESVVERWAKRNGFTMAVMEPNNGGVFPHQDNFDMLVIFGGPMSVYEEESHPWLREEKAFLREAIHSGKHILGICLGAQLIAEVLGAKVTRNRVKEIGWHTVYRTASKHPLFAGMPTSFPSFHWHGDVFELPDGAELLAYSEATPHQAFAYGDRVLALQFHLETSYSCMETMVDRWAEELCEAPYIQSAGAIRGQHIQSGRSELLLHHLLDRVAQPALLI